MQTASLGPAARQLSGAENREGEPAVRVLAATRSRRRRCRRHCRSPAGSKPARCAACRRAVLHGSAVLRRVEWLVQLNSAAWHDEAASAPQPGDYGSCRPAAAPEERKAGWGRPGRQGRRHSPGNGRAIASGHTAGRRPSGSSWRRWLGGASCCGARVAAVSHAACGSDCLSFDWSQQPGFASLDTQTEPLGGLPPMPKAPCDDAGHARRGGGAAPPPAPWPGCLPPNFASLPRRSSIA